MAKKIKANKNIEIKCKMILKREHFKTKTLTFDLTEKNNYKKTFGVIEIQYNFMKPDGYETLFGVITRGESCNGQLEKNPIGNFELKLILKDYYPEPLTYSKTKTSFDGKFEFKAPIYSYTNY